mmetsp:Transcript_158589/g.280067  ORF Transcript_158589/g.280067 Transcript_158589/m.280067 type:complete len:648 (-) Transcript_158589:45-1988(-)
MGFLQELARFRRDFPTLFPKWKSHLAGFVTFIVVGIALQQGLYDYLDEQYFRKGLAGVVMLIAIGLVIGSVVGGIACIWIRVAENMGPEPIGRRSSIGVREVTASYPPYWANKSGSGDDAPFHQLLYTDAEAHTAVQHLISETFLPISTQDRVCPNRRCPMTPGGCECVRPGGDPGMPSGLQVLTVIRVEDPQSWEQYMAKREDIRRDMYARPCFKEMDPPIMTNASAEQKSCALEKLEDELQEAYLWHGSPVRSALSIARNNFDLQAQGHRRVAYGQGIYFAECSSKADEYARDDLELQVPEGHYNGVFAMLLCRVCLGRPYYTVHRDDKAPEKVVEDGFHSTCGDRAKSAGTYREFVVYNKEQVLPEYIVLYKRDHGPPRAPQIGNEADDTLDSIIVHTDLQPLVFPAFYTEIPVHWDNCWRNLRREAFNHCEAVEIARLKLFNDFISRHTSGSWHIIGMRRIESSKLWEGYASAKGKLSVTTSSVADKLSTCADSMLLSAQEHPALKAVCTSLDPSANECLLWHTTSQEASESILAGGFRVKQTAARPRFGQGVYFSHDLNKSLEYGTRGSVSARYVLLCRVACGEIYYTEAERELDTNETAARLGKDSILANPGGTGPCEVVILQGELAYPEFALTVLPGTAN